MSRTAGLLILVAWPSGPSCARSVPTERAAQVAPAALPTATTAALALDASATSDAAPAPPAPSPRGPLSARTDGAHEIPLTPERAIY